MYEIERVWYIYIERERANVIYLWATLGPLNSMHEHSWATHEHSQCTNELLMSTCGHSWAAHELWACMGCYSWSLIYCWLGMWAEPIMSYSWAMHELLMSYPLAMHDILVSYSCVTHRLLMSFWWANHEHLWRQYYSWAYHVHSLLLMSTHEVLMSYSWDTHDS